MADAVGHAVSGCRSSQNLGRDLQAHTNTHTRALKLTQQTSAVGHRSVELQDLPPKFGVTGLLK